MTRREMLDRMMLELGFSDAVRGTAYLREMVLGYTEGEPMFKGAYLRVAQQFSTTETRVERCVRTAIWSAMERGDINMIRDVFGHSYSARRGAPTNREYMTRLAHASAQAWLKEVSHAD